MRWTFVGPRPIGWRLPQGMLTLNSECIRGERRIYELRARFAIELTYSPSTSWRRVAEQTERWMNRNNIPIRRVAYATDWEKVSASEHATLWEKP